MSKYDNILDNLLKETSWSKQNESVSVFHDLSLTLIIISVVLNKTGSFGTIHIHHIQSRQRNTRGFDRSLQ